MDNQTTEPLDHTATPSHNFAQMNAFLDGLHGADSFREVLANVVSRICHACGWTMCSIMRLDPARQFSQLVSEHNPMRTSGLEPTERWQLATSPVVKVVQSGKPLVIADALLAKDMPDYQEDATRWGYRTVVILPLRCRYPTGDAMVLSVQSVDAVDVSEGELRFLQSLAQVSSVAIEKAQILDKERDLANGLSLAAAARTDIIKRILAGEDPVHVVAGISNLIGRSVILYDQTSSTPIAALDGKRARYLEGSTAKSIAQSFHDVDLDGLSDEAAIALPDLDVAHFYNAKVYPLQIGRLTAGGLIVGDADRSDPFDALNLQEARFAAATLLMKSLAQSREQQETLSDLLLTIFSGNWRNADALRARGRPLGLDLAKPQVFFAVRGSSSATDAERHSEYQALARSCQRLGKEPAIIREGAVYLIMLSVADASDQKIDIWANHFLREMTPIWGRQVFIIVSGTCADLADYANARREIDDAFNVLEAIPRSGIVRTSAFDGTGLLLACSGHQRIETFLKNTLGPIWDAEKGNSAETLTTIRTYLESGCRFSTSAEALGIHVTTMRYRIERIKDQFGIDFSDPEARFEFDLAMRLHDFRNPTKK